MLNMLLFLMLIQLMSIAADVLQQELEIKPKVWNYRLQQSMLPNMRPPPSTTTNLHENHNFPLPGLSFNANLNYNLKPVSTPKSYYDNIIPIYAEPVQTNMLSSDNHYMDNIRSRSTNTIQPNVEPPVELHHGYRYITPAISFINTANLHTVVYNKMGWGGDRQSSLINSPKGFVLPLSPTDMQNKINFITQILKRRQNNFSKQLNAENTTILMPVEDLKFFYNRSQPHKAGSLFNLYLNQNSESQQEKQTSVAAENKSAFNAAYNLSSLPSEQISGKKPQDLYTHLVNFTKTEHVQVVDNAGTTNVQRNHKETMLKPTSIPYPHDTRFDQTENNIAAYQSHYLQNKPFSNILTNKQIAENMAYNIASNRPITNMLNNIPNLQTTHSFTPTVPVPSYIDVPTQTNGVRPASTVYHQQHKTPQNLFSSGNDVSLLEHKQNGYPSLQNHYMPAQTNDVSLLEHKQNGYPSLQNHYMPAVNRPAANEQFINYNFAKPAPKYTSYGNQQEPAYLSNFKNAMFTQDHFSNVVSPASNIDTKFPNEMSKDTALKSPHKCNQTFEQRKQNYVRFPSNVAQRHVGNLVANLETQSNENRHYTQTQNSNEFPIRYPEESYNTSPSNSPRQTIFKLLSSGDSNAICLVHLLQQNKIIPQNNTHVSHLQLCIH